MDQTVWNVLHGNGFTLTDPMGDRQESRLAVHADYLLVLLAPFYSIWSDPKMLLLIQAIIAALGAFPVYWLAKEKLKSPWLALLFGLAYLLYPPLNRKMLSDFHAVALTTAFLLYAYWFMEKRRYILFAVFAVLAGLGKEDVWLVTALMGINILVHQKRYLFGAVVAGLSLGIFVYLFWYAIPLVTPAKQHFALVYLSQFGDTQNGVFLGMLTKPLEVLRLLISHDRLYYYFQLLSPLGFLPLLSPFTLIYALPSLLINTLSNNQLMRQIDYQYSSNITPFLIISSIFGFIQLNKIVRKKLRIYSKVWLIVAILIGTFLWGELPVGKSTWFWFFITPLPEKKLMQQISTRIDSEYTVSVTNNIGSHFSQRQYLYNFPINAQTADFTVVYLGDPYAWPSGEEQLRVLKEMQNNPEYDMIASQGSFFAFKKKTL